MHKLVDLFCHVDDFWVHPEKRGPFHYCTTEFDGNVTIFHIAHNADIKCPSCRSRDVIKKRM